MPISAMDFKRIKAYQRARALAVAVHKLAVRFPRRFEHLRAQLVRSVDSIASNIAEGAPGDSKREFARFLQHSIRSASETEPNCCHRMFGAGIATRPSRSAR